MTGLEQRYRALLRVLPRWYRAQREEEMVATFMAHRRDPEDRRVGWPGWREFGAVLALAISTRIAAQHGTPQALALGDIVRLAALLGLLAQVPRTVATTADLAAEPAAAIRPEYLSYLLITATYLSTTTALIALLAGRRRLARAWAAAGAVTSLAAVILSTLPNAVEFGSARPIHAVAFFSAAWVAIACLLLGFTQDAPAPPARPWLLAGAGVVLFTVVWAAIRDAVDKGYSLPVLGDLGSSSGWLVLVATAGLPIVRRRLGVDLVPMASALALTAMAVLPDRLSYLEFAREIDMFDGIRGPLIATSIQVALLVTVAVVLGAVAVRHYRRLPEPSSGLPTG
jgi:hypothetical protein